MYCFATVVLVVDFLTDAHVFSHNLDLARDSISGEGSVPFLVSAWATSPPSMQPATKPVSHPATKPVSQPAKPMGPPWGHEP